MSIRNAILSAFFFIGGMIFAADQFAKYMYYLPVNARLTKIDDKCFMKKRTFLGIAILTQTSKPSPCGFVEFLVKNSPDWKDFEIKHEIEISFIYNSPVDKRVHDSSFKIDGFPDGKNLKVGDTMTVRASTTTPDQTRSL